MGIKYRNFRAGTSSAAISNGVESISALGFVALLCLALVFFSGNFLIYVFSGIPALVCIYGIILEVKVLLTPADCAKDIQD